MQRTTLFGHQMALAILLIAGCESGSSTPYAGSAESTSDGYGNGVPSAPAAAGGAALPAVTSVALTSSGAFQNFLADGMGRPLYVFANDVPGTSTSACTGACLDKWPVWDAKELSAGAGLTASDFTRFQRPDGSWQTAFKGRPLYRFATDAAGSVSGDGVGGRWYVARDYLAFLAAKLDVTPQGAAMPAPFMTNRTGRTVYVFMNDTAGAPPTSACIDKCLDAWPVWNAPASLDAMVLPSSMKASDFGSFERTIAGQTVKQLTYRGFPLYFHSTDTEPGATTGHMTGAWRVIDPTAFTGAK
ncbi:MAG TPA: hypothetical protein VJR89_09490 [Polyangiales bacterium]|nr:hypothetical protein [Polyangiales bacterium]